MPDPIVLRKLMPDSVTIIVAPLARDTFEWVGTSRLALRAWSLPRDDACCDDVVFKPSPNVNTVWSAECFSFSMPVVLGRATQKTIGRVGQHHSSLSPVMWPYMLKTYL
jgi:hypothetical protein